MCSLLIVAPVAPVLAQSDGDTTPPTLASAERGDATTIVVTITDDGDVDESSISLSDFELSSGLLQNATVSETGSNATVELSLVGPVDSDNVTVSLAGTIGDTTGNTLSEGSVTATGMDSQQPRLLGFSVVRLNGTHARLAVETSEPLSQLTLAIGGANAGNLDIDDFTETSQNSGTVTYARVHEFDEEGEARLLLMELTDDSGNSVGYNARRVYLVDRTPPTAAIDGPDHVTTGDAHTFDSGASDNVAVESIQWSIGPDTSRAGRSVTHTFTEPGNRTLAVTVTDGRDQRVTVEHTVTVVAGASKDGVQVSAVAANRTNATVFSDRASQRVRIADDRGRLTSRDGVAIHSLTVTPPAGESIRLSVALTGRAHAFTGATGRRSISSFTVDHPYHDSAENVSVVFAVDRSRLQAAGLAPEAVSLYRLNGSWDELPTQVHWRGPDRVQFRADSPGLSTFAIGANSETDSTDSETTNDTDDGSGSDSETSDPAPASIVVTDASLLDDTVQSGGYAIVTATVTNRGDQTGSRSIPLSANGTTVATRTVTLPPGANRTLQFATRVESPVQLSVDETTAGTVTIERTSASGGTEPTATPTPTGDETPTPTADGTAIPESNATATPTTNATATPAANATATPAANATGTPQSATTTGAGDTATASPTAGAGPATAAEITTTEDGGGGGLLPGGLVGTIVGGLVGLVVVSYGLLKAVAIYLGY